ncbi:MAG: hypothetical protein Q4D34_02060 [Eggerthellaceae bacterium]|nr:hypothetical protein [Eggerthellaceae bacterium]
MKKILAICAAVLMLTACVALAACSSGTKSGNVTVDCPLENGTYTADFKTDSSMFHINEALKGKCTLTVKDKQITAHIVLASKNIEKLFLGKKEDAQKSGAALIVGQPEKVTYSDGYTEEAYAFDVPVPYLDKEFDLALIGTKGTWYDHKVSISNPEPASN